MAQLSVEAVDLEALWMAWGMGRHFKGNTYGKHGDKLINIVDLWAA